MYRTFKLSDIQVINIVHRYHEGERAQALADEHEVALNTVLKYIRSNHKNLKVGDRVKRSHRTGIHGPSRGANVHMKHSSRYDTIDSKRKQEIWQSLQ